MGAITVLRNRDTRLYLGGVLVSGFGDSAMSLAAGIWVKTLTGSNGLAALVSFCVWFPVLLGPAIGTAVDRVRRRRLLVGTNLTLAVALTAPVAVRSAGQIWILFAVLTLVGTGTVLIDAVETALVAATVPDRLRGDFNGLVRSAIESMKLLAPAAGAGLFAVLGGPAVALLDAVSFALAAGAFAMVRVREQAPAPRTGPGWRAEIAEGTRYLWRHRPLRRLVLAGGAAMVASSLSSTATYAMLETGLHRSPAFAGVITPVQGVGSVVSGLAAGALLRRMPGRVFSAAGIALFALGVLARATPLLPLVLAGGLAIGLGLPCPLIAALTAVQRETPNELVGRVAATAGTLTFAPTGVALLIGSALVATIDYRVQIVGAALIGLGAAAALVIARERVTGASPAADREFAAD